MKDRKLNYVPMEIASPFLRKIIAEVDNRLVEQEATIQALSEELDAKEKKESETLIANLNAQQKNMAETLLAALDTPSDFNSVGTVGATILARIRDMKKIEDVHTYLDKVFAGGRAQLKKEKVSVKAVASDSAKVMK